MTSRINIFGCDFEPWSANQTVDNIQQLIHDGQRGYLCTVNVAILMMMRSNQRLANFINQAKMVVADGQPLLWVSNYMNNKLPERVSGVDLIEDLAEMAERNNWGIYLLGATDKVVNKVASQLTESYPNLTISGVSDGYFTNQEAKDKALKIQQSKAKILIVAMGVPRQEFFIEEQWKQLGVSFAIGVGGSFDILSGQTKRAPLWMQKGGLEWLYRTLQEPRRLMWRYLTTNTQFIYLFIKEIVLGIKFDRKFRQ